MVKRKREDRQGEAATITWNLDNISVAQKKIFFSSRDTCIFFFFDTRIFKGHPPQMESLWWKQSEVCPEDNPRNYWLLTVFVSSLQDPHFDIHYEL